MFNYVNVNINIYGLDNIIRSLYLSIFNFIKKFFTKHKYKKFNVSTKVVTLKATDYLVTNRFNRCPLSSTDYLFSKAPLSATDYLTREQKKIYYKNQ